MTRAGKMKLGRYHGFVFRTGGDRLYFGLCHDGQCILGLKCLADGERGRRTVSSVGGYHEGYP